jgi:nucleotide-binding universal stress UspA family protein
MTDETERQPLSEASSSAEERSDRSDLSETEAGPPAPLAAEVEYILVALDMSPHSEAALAAAAELASALHIGLHGLYVEDINLLRLCGQPFGIEYGSFTARPRRIEQNHLEREFRMQASLLRKIMADVAGQKRISWSFQVVRGGVTDQLLEAATAARMLSLGRVGRSPGKRTGSTAQAIAQRAQRPVVFQSRQRTLHGPYTVLFSGSPAAVRALNLGIELSSQEASVLKVLVPAEELAAGAQALVAATLVAATLTGPGAVYQRAETLRELLAAIDRTGVVILPVEAAAWLDEIPLTVIVVP